MSSITVPRHDVEEAGEGTTAASSPDTHTPEATAAGFDGLAGPAWTADAQPANTKPALKSVRHDGQTPQNGEA